MVNLPEREDLPDGPPVQMWRPKFSLWELSDDYRIFAVTLVRYCLGLPIDPVAAFASQRGLSAAESPKTVRLLRPVIRLTKEIHPDNVSAAARELVVVPASYADELKEFLGGLMVVDPKRPDREVRSGMQDSARLLDPTTAAGDLPRILKVETVPLLVTEKGLQHTLELVETVDFKVLSMERHKCK